MKHLLLVIALLVLTTSTAACIDLTPYPIVDVPADPDAGSCDEEASDRASCADAAADEAPADGGAPDA